MVWSTSWTFVPAAWPKENQWLKNLREQNERESKLIKEAAMRIAEDRNANHK